MYGYIYKTTNKINNKIYVGKKKSTEFLYEKYLGSGKILNNAIKKYGKENFNVEFLEGCISEEILCERERYWISNLDSMNKDIGYNLAIGGQGCGLPGRKFSKAHKQKISIANKGKIRTEEFKQNVSRTQKGHSTSEETRLKISQSNLHHPVSDETKLKMSLSKKGKPPWNKGKPSNPESIEKMKNSKRGKIWINNGNITRVIDENDLQTYIDMGFVKGRT